MADPGYVLKLVNGVPVVTAPAEIDLITAEHLRIALLEASSRQCPAFVVDMSGTHFCDSAGINTLVRAHERSQAEDTEMRLVVSTTGSVHRILTLIGVDRLIPCFGSLEDALAQTPGDRVTD